MKNKSKAELAIRLTMKLLAYGLGFTTIFAFFYFMWVYTKPLNKIEEKNNE
jgi:hypothetical protein